MNRMVRELVEDRVRTVSDRQVSLGTKIYRPLLVAFPETPPLYPALERNHRVFQKALTVSMGSSFAPKLPPLGT